MFVTSIGIPFSIEFVTRCALLSMRMLLGLAEYCACDSVTVSISRTNDNMYA